MKTVSLNVGALAYLNTADQLSGQD